MGLDLSLFERFAKQYSADQIIFCEYEPGDSFYLIDSGQVKIVKILGNIEKTIDVLQPGEFFGEMALLENAPRSATTIAMNDCKVLEFNRDNFTTLMMSNPLLALKLLHLLAKRIYDQKRRFSILTLEDDDARVADVFVMLNEQSSSNTESDTGKRDFNYSIADIAHWAGMAPKRCREIINNFQKKNRVSVSKKGITVTNIHDFNRLVNSQRKNQSPK